MSSLNFDPYAQLAKQDSSPAKSANPAKVENNHLSLASLATLAARTTHSSNIWDAADWHAFYHERAGIAEHDGGLSRIDADHMTYEHCVVRWMNENPIGHKSPGICPQCSQATGSNPIAVLNPGGGHLWLHDKCHSPCLARRRQEAAKALVGMGIEL